MSCKYIINQTEIWQIISQYNSKYCEFLYLRCITIYFKICIYLNIYIHYPGIEIWNEQSEWLVTHANTAPEPLHEQLCEQLREREQLCEQLLHQMDLLFSTCMNGCVCKINLREKHVHSLNWTSQISIPVYLHLCDLIIYFKIFTCLYFVGFQ